MNAWLHLVKKEFRLGLPFLLTISIISIIFSILAVYLGFKLENTLSLPTLVILSFLMVCHIFFLVFYVLNSLQRENSTLHLWLHSPFPSYVLLLAKITSGLLSLLISISIPAALSIVILTTNLSPISLDGFIAKESIWQVIWLTLGAVLLVMIMITVFIMFCWIIYRYLKQFLPSFFSLFIMIVGIFLLLNLYSLFTDTAFFDWLTGWGEITLAPIMVGMEFDFTQVGSDIDIRTVQPSLFIGDFLFDLLLIFCLFFITSWILDKKIEV
ncbi:hypothetical protein BTS2_3612 [Bacillus sp. TS-2]|nr:hypothetical protein BTS2_3612 [Bacillus sp. TS-2]